MSAARKEGDDFMNDLIDDAMGDDLMSDLMASIDDPTGDLMVSMDINTPPEKDLQREVFAITRNVNHGHISEAQFDNLIVGMTLQKSHDLPDQILEIYRDNWLHILAVTKSKNPSIPIFVTLVG